MTRLDKARAEILDWMITHNSHPSEWKYYRRERKRLKMSVKHRHWVNLLGQ